MKKNRGTPKRGTNAPLAERSGGIRAPAPAAADSLIAGAPTSRAAGSATSCWSARGPIFALLAVVFLLGCTQMADVDVWWHLRTGQLIVARHALPAQDWFTYGNPEARWIDINWLWQLATLGVWSFAGVPGLIVFKALLGVATFALIYLGSGRGKLSAWDAALTGLLPVLFFAVRYPVRPEMLSFLLLSAMLVICYHVPRRPRLIAVLPLIAVIWVNVHGSFVLGPAVTGCFLAGAIVARFRPFAQPSPPNDDRGTRHGALLRLWAAALALVLAACLINPYGYRAFELAAVLGTRIGSGETAYFYKHLASELLSATESGPKTVLRTLLVAALGAGTCLATWRRTGLDPARLLLIVFFTYLGWQTQKNLPYLAVTTAAVVYWNLDDLAAWTAAHDPAALAKPLWYRSAVAAVLGLLMIAIPSGLYFPIAHAGEAPIFARRFGFGERPGVSAHQEAEFLARRELPERLFAFCHSMASAYIFRNGPERKVFVDGRLEVSAEDNYRKLLEIVGLLVARDPRAEDELLATVRQGNGSRGATAAAALRATQNSADEMSRAELPAVLVDLTTFAFNAAALMDHPRWMPVFAGDAGVVLLYRPEAERLRLPPLDRAALRARLAARIREVSATPAEAQKALATLPAQ